MDKKEEAMKYWKLLESVRELSKQNLDLEAKWLMTRDALESAEAEIKKLKKKGIAAP